MYTQPSSAPRRPTYLRVVVTTRCNHQCTYCHMEGDPHQAGSAHELPLDVLCACLDVMAACGMRKIKLLGGEPLMRADLPRFIAHMRKAAPKADLSMITAGGMPTRALTSALEAGLDRVNVSIHGFGADAFARRNSNPLLLARRGAFIEALLHTGRPVKLNYVYSGPEDTDDLAAMLDWAAGLPVLVNVLDNLERDLGWRQLERMLTTLRGAPAHTSVCHDPDSLDTLHLTWADGLRVELKDQQLGQHAPWADCARCPVRADCKEGIFALRLTHKGVLMPCMDRPELGLPLARLIDRDGVSAAEQAVEDYIAALIGGAHHTTCEGAA
jgi:cyclic pyranopterin phosphate synthase